MKSTLPAALALVAFVASFGGIWFYTNDGQPKCDSAEAVATIKNMALDRGFGGRFFSAQRIAVWRQTSIDCLERSSQGL
jgi:hypothetical protein